MSRERTDLHLYWSLWITRKLPWREESRETRDSKRLEIRLPMRIRTQMSWEWTSRSWCRDSGAPTWSRKWRRRWTASKSMKRLSKLSGRIQVVQMSRRLCRSSLLGSKPMDSCYKPSAIMSLKLTDLDRRMRNGWPIWMSSRFRIMKMRRRAVSTLRRARGILRSTDYTRTSKARRRNMRR